MSIIDSLSIILLPWETTEFSHQRHLFPFIFQIHYSKNLISRKQARKLMIPTSDKFYEAIDAPVNRRSEGLPQNVLGTSPFHSPSRFLFLARSASRTSWLGAASARSSSWWVGGSVGPSGGMAPGGGRGIITGGPAAAPSGRARPPDVWWRELWAAIGPLLGRFVDSVATGGCTAADIDRSTPPSSTGRQPPEAPLPLTAGRIPPPPGSGAYGRYSSSLRASSCNRVEKQFRRAYRRPIVSPRRPMMVCLELESLCDVNFESRRRLTFQIGYKSANIDKFVGHSKDNSCEVHPVRSGLRENWWNSWIISWIIARQRS